MQNEQGGEAFCKQHRMKHLLCVNWSTGADSGVSQAFVESSITVRLRNFVFHSQDWSVCDTSASFWQCLPQMLFCLSSLPVLPMPHHSSAHPRTSLPSHHLCRSVPICSSFSILSLSESQKHPNTGMQPTSLQTPRLPPETKFTCNRLTSRVKTWAPWAGRQKMLRRGPGNSKHRATTKHFRLLLRDKRVIHKLSRTVRTAQCWIIGILELSAEISRSNSKYWSTLVHQDNSPG